MMIILVSVPFCLALNFVPEAPALLVGIETDAAILSVTVLTLINLRVWLTGRESSTGASPQPQS